MKKILLASLLLAGIGTLIPTFVSANIQGSYKARVDNSSTQWFFDQEYSSTALSPFQCAGANVSRRYYLPSDYNNDGIKDYGSPLYLRDNFRVVGGTTPTYLIEVRTGGYGGSVVRYQHPSGVSNVLRVLNGTTTYDLNTQSAWFRLSSTSPKDIRVRAVESEPMLISAPSTNNIAHNKFQVAYQIKYRAFAGVGSSTSDYTVWPVSSSSYMGGLSQFSDRWALRPNWAPVPDWQIDYQQTSSTITTTNIQWNTQELIHAYECYNVETHWCGDGVQDTGPFDNTSASEQCDLGSQNGQPGSACTASCMNVPAPLPPDVTVIKAVSGSRIQGQNVTYTITYRNIGSGAANNVVVTDVLDAGLTFIPSASFPTATSVVVNPNGTTTITWNRGSMPAGSQGIIRFDAQIKQTVPNCSTVINNVQVAASNEPSNMTLNNSYSVTHPIQCPGNPQLRTQKDVNASTGGYVPNGYAVYTIRYGNTGSGTANNVVVTDTLPSDVTYHTSFPTPTSIVGQTLTWNIGNVPAGGQGIIRIYVKINANVPICQSHTVLNKGRVTASNAGPVEDDATFLVLCYDLWSNKIIDKPVVASGDVVTYTIRYGNFGPLVAPNWSLVDSLPTGMNYIINSTTVLSGVNIGQPVITGNPTIGQTLTWTGFTNMPAGYSGLVQIKATVLGPVASGHVYVNKICIDGDNNYNNNNCGEATTTVTGGTSFFDLNIKKSVDKTVVANGDKVVYSIVVTNESDVTSPATGFTVNDYLPGGVNYSGNPTGPAGMTTTVTGKDITFGNLPALNPGGTFTITFEAIYNSTTQETNFTEICTYNGFTGSGVKDRDSNPCNRGRNNAVEDDEAQVTIGPGGGPGGQNPECQGLSASPTINNLITSAASVQVNYECRTTWGAYPVSATLDCGNGQIFTGTTIDGNPFKASCTYNNPTNTRAVCVVANRPNVNCELPVSVKPGGGGGRNPYCGDGIYDPSRGEQCDPGNPLLGIKPAGVPAGKVCRADCTFADRPPGITAQVKCSYIDPPAINVGEYMPYRWDMEYGSYQAGGSNYSAATSSCTSEATDTRINKNSLVCEFTLTGPNGASKVWSQPCYTNPGLQLINSAFNAAKIRYDMDIIPGGYDAKQITGAYYLGLGEYRIEMRTISGKLCNGTSIAMEDRVCQMNFGVTKQYAVTRSSRGTSSTANDLDTYKRQDNSKVLKTNELIKALEPFTLVNADKNLIAQMANKYVGLAVKADTIEDKLANNTTVTKAIVSKVPGKNIFVIDAKTPDGKKGLITILDNSTYQGGAFTLIVINGDLVIKGNLTKNPNGMFIVRDGDLTFSAIADAKENNQDQLVKGIFIGLGNVRAEGDGYQKAFNDDLNKPWINGGRLTINGLMLGGDLSKLIEGRRSVVESWFDKGAADGLLDDGAIVIKANPEIFTNLPPGAEDISLTLNVFKN